MKRFLVVICLFMTGVGAWAQLVQNCDHYQEMIDGGEATPRTFYEAARCFASTGRSEFAFTYLTMAVDSGYDNLPEIQRDGNLANLRGDARWHDLIARVKVAHDAQAGLLNAELKGLYEESRQNIELDRPLPKGREEDVTRLNRVNMIVKDDGLKVAQDYFHAASLYVLGSDVAHFKTAQSLARKAAQMSTNLPGIFQLVAQCEDRLLVSQGKPQVWGTEFEWRDERWHLAPMDASAKTDKERQAMGLHSVEELKRRVNKMNQR